MKADREFESRPHRQKFTMENKNVKWHALKFIPHQKTAVWFITFFVIAGALITYAIYTRNLLTIVTFSIFTVIVLIFAVQKPGNLEYEISTTGVRMGQMFIPYRNIKKFWIIYHPENKTVNFETTAYLNNQISLQLGSQDPIVIRQFLKNYLQEDLEKEESLSEIISRKVKF